MADIDHDKLLPEFAARPRPSEEEIERQAAEDGDAWTEEELANAIVVDPPPSAEQVKAVRARLGLSQVRFALRFGVSVDTIRQYEQGRRVPSGPASTLLKNYALPRTVSDGAEAFAAAVGHPSLPRLFLYTDEMAAGGSLTEPHEAFADTISVNKMEM